MPQQPSLVRRLFLTFAVLSTAVALVVFFVSAALFQLSAVEDAHVLLSEEATLVSSALGDASSDAEAKLAGLEMRDTRVTLIEPDGTVSFDSDAEADDMPSHADRPEFEEARKDGSASVERPSETMGYVSIYQATRLADGSVLRLSVDRAGVVAMIFNEALLLLLVDVVLIISSLIAAHVLARRLVAPILKLDPAHPDASQSYAEIAPLVNKISSQQELLAQQVEELKGADAMRREFTANVTHELKTPLASISGAAELIKSGIVKPKDNPDYAGRIYAEAQRLASLVNDILMLSKLDESERSQDRSFMGSDEPVDLYRVAHDVVDRLGSAAHKKQVSLELKGKPVFVRGLPRLLDEMVQNLCSNAIRYNKEGGSVKVTVATKGGLPVLVVADTGIGIPSEHQSKVFERFYRVDPARARETGGTGLGLAIVKHAVMYHNADIDLVSTPGEGTTITVTFPPSLVPSRLKHIEDSAG